MLRLCPARRGTKTEWFTGSTCWANQTGRTIRSRRARHPHGATSQQRCSEIKNMFHFLSETQEARQRMCKLKTRKKTTPCCSEPSLQELVSSPTPEFVLWAGTQEASPCPHSCSTSQSGLWQEGPVPAASQTYHSSAPFLSLSHCSQADC